MTKYSDLLKAEIKKTNGKACENGCPSNNNHNCPPYKLLISTKPFSEAQPNINENVREEAIRLGISLSECRRRRSGR